MFQKTCEIREIKYFNLSIYRFVGVLGNFRITFHTDSNAYRMLDQVQVTVMKTGPYYCADNRLEPGVYHYRFMSTATAPLSGVDIETSEIICLENEWVDIQLKLL